MCIEHKKTIAPSFHHCNLVVVAISSIGIAMYKLDPYITEVLLRDLVGHDRRPASFLVYIWFTAETTTPRRPRQHQLSGPR